MKWLLFLIIVTNTFCSELKEVKTINTEYPSIYTKENYKLFLDGLKIYNKSAKDRTKNEKMILTEAEKYFEYDYQTDEKYFWEIIEERDGSAERYKPIPYKVMASSHLDENYLPKNLCDNSYKTAWIEGKADYGIGEYVDFYCNNTKLYKKIGLTVNEKINDITRVYIYNGYSKNNKLWEENSRVKKLKMYVQGKEWIIINLQDFNGEQYCEIPPIIYDEVIGDATNKRDLVIRFEIMEIYKGTKYKDTSITEVLFATDKTL